MLPLTLYQRSCLNNDVYTLIKILNNEDLIDEYYDTEIDRLKKEGILPSGFISYPYKWSRMSSYHKADGFYQACINGHINIFRLLCEKNPDDMVRYSVNEIFLSNCLYYSYKNSQIAMMDYLISLFPKIDSDMINSKFGTACNGMNYVCIKYFIELYRTHKRFKPLNNAVILNGFRIICRAGGNLEIIKYFLTLYETDHYMPIDIYHTHHERGHPFFAGPINCLTLLCCNRADINIIKYLINLHKYNNVYKPFDLTYNNNITMHIAIQYERLDIVKYLIRLSLRENIKLIRNYNSDDILISGTPESIKLNKLLFQIGIINRCYSYCLGHHISTYNIL